MRFGGNVDRGGCRGSSKAAPGAGATSRLKRVGARSRGAPLDVTRELESLREVYTLGFDQTSVDEAIAEKSGDMHAAVCGLFTARARPSDGGGVRLVRRRNGDVERARAVDAVGELAYEHDATDVGDERGEGRAARARWATSRTRIRRRRSGSASEVEFE